MGYEARVNIEDFGDWRFRGMTRVTVTQQQHKVKSSTWLTE